MHSMNSIQDKNPANEQSSIYCSIKQINYKISFLSIFRLRYRYQSRNFLICHIFKIQKYKKLENLTLKKKKNQSSITNSSNTIQILRFHFTKYKTPKKIRPPNKITSSTIKVLGYQSAKYLERTRIHHSVVVATIGSVLVGIVLVRAENVVGAEIETLGSRIGSAGRSRSHNSKDPECSSKSLRRKLGFLERKKQ